MSSYLKPHTPFWDGGPPQGINCERTEKNGSKKNPNTNLFF